MQNGTIEVDKLLDSLQGHFTSATGPLSTFTVEGAFCFWSPQHGPPELYNYRALPPVKNTLLRFSEPEAPKPPC